MAGARRPGKDKLQTRQVQLSCADARGAALLPWLKRLQALTLDTFLCRGPTADRRPLGRLRLSSTRAAGSISGDRQRCSELSISSGSRPKPSPRIRHFCSSVVPKRQSCPTTPHASPQSMFREILSNFTWACSAMVCKRSHTMALMCIVLATCSINKQVGKERSSLCVISQSKLQLASCILDSERKWELSSRTR